MDSWGYYFKLFKREKVRISYLCVGVLERWIQDVGTVQMVDIGFLGFDQEMGYGFFWMRSLKSMIVVFINILFGDFLSEWCIEFCCIFN